MERLRDEMQMGSNDVFRDRVKHEPNQQSREVIFIKDSAENRIKNRTTKSCLSFMWVSKNISTNLDFMPFNIHLKINTD